jgi:hypothetical protein
MNRYNINLYKDIVRIPEYDNCIDQYYYEGIKKNVIVRYIRYNSFGILINKYNEKV